MKHPISSITSYIILFLSMINCSDNKARDIYSKYKPVLIENSKINICTFQPSIPSKNISQIRNMGNYMLALEYGIGIHIIDNTLPSNPVKIGFYNIPACIDFETKNNLIFANNYKDFITVDFTVPTSPIIIKREENTFDIKIKTPDNLEVYEGLKKIPSNATIISYEKI